MKSVNKEKFVLRAYATTAVKKKKSLQLICLSAVCLSLAVGYSPFSALFFFFFLLFSPTRRVWHLSTCFSLLFRGSFTVIAALQGLKLLLLRPSLLSASFSQNV